MLIQRSVEDRKEESARLTRDLARAMTT